MRAGESSGAAKSYSRGNLTGKGEGLKRGRRRALPGVRCADGWPKSYFRGDGKWWAGGLKRGRGGKRKITPKEIAMEEGGGKEMGNHFRNMCLPPE